MSQSDNLNIKAFEIGDQALSVLGGLPLDEDGPVFAEPWQAQAFAMAVHLSQKGFFSWSEWAQALANELETAANLGNPDDGSHYYYHWVAALEKLVTGQGFTNGNSLAQCKTAWAEAYEKTPHGQAVQLDRHD